MTTSFTFDGIDSSQYFLVTKIRRSVVPPIKDKLVVVPNRPGAYDFGWDYQVREIEVDIAIKAQTIPELRQKVRDIAKWLTTSEAKPLIFSDEPDKMYYARLSGDTNLDQMAELGQGTLKFICPDPYAYAASPTTLQVASSPFTVNNPGTADTYPVITVAFSQPATFFGITKEKEYVMVGSPESVEEAPFVEQELVLWDECADLSAWQTGTILDGTGVISGSMGTANGYFYVTDYGTGSGWHGPALKRSLPAPIQDFRVDTLVVQNNLVGETGRVEVYLLDVNGAVIGKIMIGDYWKDSKLNWIEARAGAYGVGHYWYAEYGAYKGILNNFLGLLRIERRGNRWYAYFGMIDPYPGGRHTTRTGRYWVDVNNQFNAQLAQVEIHMGKYGTTAPNWHQIDDIKVYKFNQPGTAQVPYIVQAGDILEIDCLEAVVRKNGQPFMQAVDLGSSFFSLMPGDTELAYATNGSGTIAVSYRARWI